MSMASLVPRPFCILQVIKNWRWEWPGNEASICMNVVSFPVHQCCVYWGSGNETGINADVTRCTLCWFHSYVATSLVTSYVRWHHKSGDVHMSSTCIASCHMTQTWQHKQNYHAVILVARSLIMSVLTWLVYIHSSRLPVWWGVWTAFGSKDPHLRLWNS